MNRWTWWDTAFVLSLLCLTATGVAAMVLQIGEHYRLSIIPVTTCVGVDAQPKALSVNPFAATRRTETR
jgi:hypothetical protein